MKRLKTHVANLSIAFIASGILCLDLFTHPGEPATFDSQIHITNIAMYHRALSDGDFPVTWADGFSNYGLATPLVSQQLTSYLGAFFTFLTNNPLVSYKLLIFIGAFLSSSLTYYFLKLYASPQSSLAGMLLFNFTAYRIFNIYIRGALPEFFAAAFIPLVLIGIHQLSKRERNGFFITIIGMTLLILSHPFVFVIGMFLFIPYIITRSLEYGKKPIYFLLQMALATGIALLVSAWYVLPLIFEMKYFVISKNDTQLVNDQFMSWKNYVITNWQYYSSKDVFVRGNNIFFGTVEFIVLVAGSVWLLIKKYKQKKHLLSFISITAVGLVFMTTSWSRPIYQLVPYLDGIQFPWRMLSALIFIPPLILALSLDLMPTKKWLILLVILIISLNRFPELYGKNFTLYPQKHYYRTIKNLHFDSMNTLWTGTATDYPIKEVKGEIIEGDGQIVFREEKNSYRNYQVVSDTAIRMIDYTFYFPGWNVYINNQPAEIQFQDPSYRGVITYFVPPGTHQIKVEFRNTKVRQLGNLISLASIIGCSSLAIIMWKKNESKRSR